MMQQANENNKHLTEQVNTSLIRHIPEKNKIFHCTYSVYVKRAKTGKTQTICEDWDNVHNTGGVDFLHYQGYTSTGTGSSSSITTATQGSNWMGFSSDTGGASAGDTVLAGEITSNGLARAQCTTRSHTAGTNVTVLSLTVTATAHIAAVQKGAIFNAATAGVMNHEYLFASTDLNSGDELTIVVTVTGG